MDTNMLEAALIFQDYCVLQCQKPIRIWGTAPPSHQITATLNQQSAYGISDSSGNWELWFSSMEACSDTQLKLLDQSSGKTLNFSYIAIGEVWVAGGQSNMEFLMRYDEDRYMEFQRSDCDAIRYFQVPHRAFEGDPMDISESGHWRICDRDNLEYFSAVGYYFAKDLEHFLHVPVGIIACNWGGTSAMTWMPKNMLSENVCLKTYLESYELEVKELDLKEYEADFCQSRLKMNQLAKDSNHQIQHWICREDQLSFVREKKLEEYGLAPSLPMGPWHQNAPGRLYESMLLKIAGVAMRGVIWYQGESDVERGENYDILFQSVIQSWRALWQEELPWLFVQLAPFYKWLDQDGNGFPLIRQKQELVSKTVPSTWMISTTDCGMKWGIHPTRKKLVGKRLSFMARGKVYGEDILCDAPECIQAKLQGDKIILTFLHSGGGMELHDEVQNDLFVICGQQRIEIKHPKCQGNCVILTSDFAFGSADSVEFLNLPYGESMLYSSAGLPAKPFVITIETG